MRSRSPPLPPRRSTPRVDVAPLNRLAVIADDRIYTIDPDGSDQLDLAHNGQRAYRRRDLVARWTTPDLRRDRTQSESRDQRPPRRAGDVAMLFETDRTERAFLSEWLAGRSSRGLSGTRARSRRMELHIAQTDRPNSARLGPDRPAQLFFVVARQPIAAGAHRRRSRADAFVGTYDLSAHATPARSKRSPAAFQAPVWSPTGEAQLAVCAAARSTQRVGDRMPQWHRRHAERRLTAASRSRSSPDGQHVAYALNTPDSFLYQGPDRHRSRQARDADCLQRKPVGVLLVARWQEDWLI